MIAIVVTHNRAKKLKTCLDHLLESSRTPDEILVINNASSDGTVELLFDYRRRFQKLTAFHLDTNVGGAGGFEYGMREAYKRQADFFWLMDDDCYVDISSLEEMIRAYTHLTTNHRDKEIGFICSKVNWCDGVVSEMNQPSVDWDYLRDFNEDFPILKVIGASFVSCLITRQAVASVGYPLGEFFIWFDDAEYTRRISAKFDCYCVPSSKVTHDMQKNEGVWFGNVDQYNIGKFCYGVRNESWYRYHRQSFSDWVFFVVRVYKEMKVGNVDKRYRTKILLCIINGFTGQFIK